MQNKHHETLECADFIINLYWSKILLRYFPTVKMGFRWYSYIGFKLILLQWTRIECFKLITLVKTVFSWYSIQCKWFSVDTSYTNIWNISRKQFPLYTWYMCSKNQLETITDLIHSGCSLWNDVQTSIYFTPYIYSNVFILIQLKSQLIIKWTFKSE